VIDLSVPVRSLILATPAIANLLPAYQNSKAVFTRRPAPADATGLMVFVSPMIGGGVDSDLLRSQKREVTYDISVYGPNDTATNYRKAQDVGFALAQTFHRLDPRKLDMPEGWHLVRAKCFGPMPAPTDDQKIVGRMVSVQFLIAQNTASAVTTP